MPRASQPFQFALLGLPELARCAAHGHYPRQLKDSERLREPMGHTSRTAPRRGEGLGLLTRRMDSGNREARPAQILSQNLDRLVRGVGQDHVLRDPHERGCLGPPLAADRGEIDLMAGGKLTTPGLPGADSQHEPALRLAPVKK
jgi:hypothetical protein